MTHAFLCQLQTSGHKSILKIHEKLSFTNLCMEFLYWKVADSEFGEQLTTSHWPI